DCNPAIYAEIVTTAVFDDSVEVCLDAGSLGAVCPAGARLYHFDPSLPPPNNFAPLPVGPHHAPESGRVCGLTTHFSTFAAFQPASAVPLPQWGGALLALALCGLGVRRAAPRRELGPRAR